MAIPAGNKISADDILRLAAVPKLPSVFVLGSFASKVTISSQQTRAFNLIWALTKAGLLKEGDSVAVVGGGFAGLSAAVAAMQRKAIVTLYEERAQLLHMQRGNLTRFLHPNILDWPHKRSQSRETRLPYLNWSADTASRVVEKVLTQWAALKSSPFLKAERRNSAVERISIVGDRPRIILPKDGRMCRTRS